MKKIKPAVSERNNLVQLADMVCGSIYRSMLVGKGDHLRYRGIIEGKALEKVRVSERVNAVETLKGCIY
jgi:hypothetical protein